MTRHYKNYTDEDLRKGAAEAYSLRSLVIKLGLVPRGGNFNTIKAHLRRLNIDTSHWKGQAWSKNIQKKDFPEYKGRTQIKAHLINLRGHFCEECGLSEWRGRKIVLELDHNDGNKHNNSPENLRLLCPNCHSFTPTWRGRKSKAHT